MVMTKTNSKNADNSETETENMTNKATKSKDKVKSKMKTSSNHKTILEGEKVYRSFTEEQKDKLFSLEGTIHFVNLLGTSSQTSGLLKTEDGSTKYAMKVVGVKLRTDIDIEVPVISVLKDKKTGIAPEDVSSRNIKAGEEFNLNMYEVMLLITRPEYSGCITRDGHTRGVYFSARTVNYYNGKEKLPTPSLSARTGTGALRDSTIAIDKKISRGAYVIKDEYKKEFGELIKEPKNKDIGEDVTSGVLTALAINNMLKKSLGLG